MKYRYDYNHCGRHKPISVDSVEQALEIVRSQFGSDVYKQGSVAGWSFFLPSDSELVIAECFAVPNGWKLRIKPSK